MLEHHKFDRLLDLVEQRADHWLALQVEQGKIGLSDADTVQLSLDRIAPQQTLQLRRLQFNNSIGHLVGSVEDTLTKLLHDAGVSVSQDYTMFFFGGSSGRATVTPQDRCASTIGKSGGRRSVRQRWSGPGWGAQVRLTLALLAVDSRLVSVILIPLALA